MYTSRIYVHHRVIVRRPEPFSFMSEHPQPHPCVTLVTAELWLSHVSHTAAPCIAVRGCAHSPVDELRPDSTFHAYMDGGILDYHTAW